MTDLATALASGDLGEFEGQDVLRTTIAIRNAGDGLSEAMKVEPRVLHHREKVYVVLETEVADVQFPPIKDTDCVARKHVLKAGTATIVDASLVKEVLDEQAERIVLAKEEAEGVQRLKLAAEKAEADTALEDAEREAEEAERAEQA